MMILGCITELAIFEGNIKGFEKRGWDMSGI